MSAVGISSSSYFFLILLEESLLLSVEMYSNMIAVRFKYIYQTLIGVDVFSIIVCQESLVNVVD